MSALQQDLLAILDRVQSVPRTRSSHPVSSEKAEIRARESGRMKKQAMECLAVVAANPGLTSKQLGTLALDRYIFARRLPELLAANLVTRTDSDVESRWWPV